MLQNSFVVLPRVHHRTEKSIWKQDIHSWQDFSSANKIKGFSAARKEHCDWCLQHAKKCLRNGDASYFAGALPFSEQWRLYDEFKDEACFLDIETSGYYGSVTVVGISDGVDALTFVRGFNLDKSAVENVLGKYKLLLTFNGASFDLPVLKRYFNLNINIPHIDLRFACQRAGFSGGLKSIEKELNIKRRDEVSDMAGDDAVYLWEMWKSTGNREFLEKLVMYNEEDILNLKPIADIIIPELWKKIRATC